MRRNVFIGVFLAVLAAIAVAPNLIAPEAAVKPEAQTSVSSTDSASSGAEERDGASEETEQPGEAQNGAEPNYEQGAVLVGLRDGATADDLNARLATLDYVATKQVAESDVTFGYARLALADGVSVEDARARLADENPDVIAAAQPNYVYHAIGDAADAPNATALVASAVAQAITVNDPAQVYQWAFDAVNAEEAWGAMPASTATATPVTVAVLDSGIATSHEDFDYSKIVSTLNTAKVYDESNPNDKGKYETGKNAQSVEDGNGHGTHVTGIIAATADNGKGVAGITDNLVNIMAIRGLADDGEGYTNDLTTALEYVIRLSSTQNVKVVNMSLGCDEYDQSMEAALAQLHEKGILTVYAAGNDGASNKGFPCDYDDDPGAIGVISVDSNYKRSSFSNYNMDGQATKDLSAPGGAILSTTIPGMSSTTYLSEAYENFADTGKNYGFMSGTSMAAPYVSGIAALVFAANPSLTPAQVRNILCNTAKDIGATGWDNETGHGLIDAAAAVRAATAGTNTTANLAGATITLSQTSFTYSGSARKPGVTVKLNGETLTAGTDYTVGYSNNVNAGTAKVTVAGKGAYTGTASKAFTIKAKAVTPTVKLGATKYTYNGSAKKPSVTVKVGSTKLTASNYRVTWASGRKNVGKYTVKVALKGNYSGSAKATFVINPKDTSISKATAAKKGFTVRWKKQAAQTTGYQVQYSLKSNFASGSKTLTIKKTSTVSKAVTKLKAKKKYYLRVRTYKTVGSVKYYSAWSAKTSVKTKA